MSADGNKALFRRTYEELLNGGDLSVAEELVALDFINHEAPSGRDRGPESMRGLATMLRSAFPDLHFEIEELIAEGDIVAGRLTMSGTHEGPLMGTPPYRALGASGPHALRALQGRQGYRTLGGEGRPRHDEAVGPHARTGTFGGSKSHLDAGSPQPLFT